MLDGRLTLKTQAVKYDVDYFVHQMRTLDYDHMSDLEFMVKCGLVDRIDNMIYANFVDAKAQYYS